MPSSAIRTSIRPGSHGGRVMLAVVPWLALVLLLPPAWAESVMIDCEAVLRDGVFDEHGVRRLDRRIQQAKDAVCGRSRSSQSFSVEIGAGLSAAERDTLCGSAPGQLGGGDEERELIDRVGSLAATAFNECARRNAGEVSHGIFTTDDPGVFTYHLQRTPSSVEPSASVEVDAFEAHNARCRPPLSRGTEISPGRRTLICTRDPQASVVIVLNTKDNVGTRYLEPLRLDGVTGAIAPAARAAEPVPSAGPVTMHRYNRFRARRQLRESSCDNPSVELEFEERTQVKLLGEAVAQGGASRYPLWIRLTAGGQVACEQQSWAVSRGRVTEECLVWVEANKPLRVQAEQGSKDARCIRTDLEVWY